MDYNNSLFLTLDTDWVSGRILEYTIEILESYKVKATIFVTDRIDILCKLRKSKSFELGIHPNFNCLLEGTCADKNYKIIIEEMLAIAPGAMSMRAHSLTNNSRILFDVSNAYGIKYDVNIYVPFSSGISLLPFNCSSGVIRVPFIWGDYQAISSFNKGCKHYWNAKRLLDVEGLKVFNFHPIHIFLNTETIERYNSVKKHIKNYEYIKSKRNTKECGIQTVLENLIIEAKKRQYEFCLISDIRKAGDEW